VDLAPGDCHLVAQHDDLDGETRVTATDESDELENAAVPGTGTRLSFPDARRGWDQASKSSSRSLDDILGTDRWR
jgi:hypothetical protein